MPRQRIDEATDRHILMMTDADYREDMHAVLSRLRPVLCYTMQPTSVCDYFEEGHFTITSDSLLRHSVSGGATVAHPIWDYTPDIIATPRHGQTMISTVVDAIHHLCTGKKTAYTVLSYCDRWEDAPHRNFVALTPFAVVPTLIAAAMDVRPLVMHQYDVGGGYNAIVNYRGNPVISVARHGEMAKAELPLATLQSVRIAHEQTKSKQLSDTIRRSGLTNLDGPVLHAYLNATTATPAEQYDPSRKFHFQVITNDPTPDELFQEPKTYARKYASAPLGYDALAPMITTENARASIDGRITKPSKASNNSVITSDYALYAEEFVQELVPESESNTGIPWSVDEVNEQQTRPMQRARALLCDMDYEEQFVVRAFTKREFYSAPTDPRNISGVPTTHNLRLSGFTYAFKGAVLKAQSWYVPGRKPGEIAEAMQALADQHDALVETDFSRFDGSINRFLRVRVEQAAYLRWVAPAHRQELFKLLNAELDSKAYLHGLAYEPGSTRLSGSPLTSDGNTMINAFVQYCMMRKNGCAHRTAYDNLGLLCGDDAVVPSMTIPDESRIRVAKRLGLTLTIERTAHRNGPTRVTFLSRVFKDPWTSSASIQDPKRTLAKIHLTTDAGVPLSQAGLAKARGYRVTDARSPVVGAWVDCYIRNTPETDVLRPSIDIPYFSQEQFHESPWPQADGFEDIVAEELGISAAELTAYEADLNAYTGPADGMPSLSLLPPAAKVDAVVGDEILQAGSIADNSATTSSHAIDHVKSLEALSAVNPEQPLAPGAHGSPGPAGSSSLAGTGEHTPGAAAASHPAPRTGGKGGKAGKASRRSADATPVNSRDRPGKSGAGRGGNGYNRGRSTRGRGGSVSSAPVGSADVIRPRTPTGTPPDGDRYYD